MLRVLLHPVFCLVAGCVSGALVVALAHQTSMAPPPAELPRVQVEPGETWARAWDVDNGTDLPNFTGYAGSPVAARIFSGNELVGLILEDGRCVVIRRENYRVSTVLLCERRPIYRY